MFSEYDLPADKLPAKLRDLMARAEQGDPDAQRILGKPTSGKGTACLMKALSRFQEDDPARQV